MPAARGRLACGRLPTRAGRLMVSRHPPNFLRDQAARGIQPREVSMQILPRQPQQSRQTQSWNEHRPAAVAGLFYPARRDALRAVLDKLLQDAAPPGETAPEKLRALIVPHAGYIYSGPVAASAYALLRGAARGIQRVILLGPAHWYPHQGLALAPARHHDTPLGAVNVDCDLAERLLSLPRVSCSHEAHAREHSLEVQLPFLQRLLPNPRILALTVGDSSAEQVAEVLDAVHSLPGNLVLVSSDLSLTRQPYSH